MVYKITWRWDDWSAPSDETKVVLLRSFHPEGNSSDMTSTQPNNLLHGLTLEMILATLVEKYGWDELGRRIPIRCFTDNPSIKSSLKFLRRVPWARKKVEDLYLESLT